MAKNIRKITPETALERLMALCSRVEKSPFEISRKLKEWGLENEEEVIIGKLREEKFLDERRFASAFVRDKFRFNKWGTVKIRFHLKGHQIDEGIIEAALRSLDKNAYKKMIWQELNRKSVSIHSGNAFQKKAKIYAYGIQRGYEPEMINAFLGEEGL